MYDPRQLLSNIPFLGIGRAGAPRKIICLSIRRKLTIMLGTIPSGTIFLLFVLAAAYTSTIAYAYWAGYEVPTTALVNLAPYLATYIASLEPWLSRVLLAVAGLGAALTWLSRVGVLDLEIMSHTERTLTAVWSRCGVVVCFALLVLSTQTAGYAYTREPNSSILAGLLPFSDSSIYFTNPTTLSLFGSWDSVASRRPLAAAFRQMTMLISNYSFFKTILLQTAFNSVLLWLATVGISRWRGFWAGIAFFALVYGLGRPYIWAVMTEPLAQIWSLIAVVFLVEALSKESRQHATLFFLATCLALFTRTGSLFTIPFLAIWVSLSFARSSLGRLKLLGVTIGAFLAIFSLNFVIAYLYGAPGAATGSNFAFVACGVSMGADWTACSKKYHDQLAMMPNEAEQARFLLMQAWDTIRASPWTALENVFSNVVGYVTSVPRSYVDGGTGAPSSSMTVALVTAIGCAALARFITTMATSKERTLWIGIGMTVLASASLLWRDDGWRALHVTNIFLAFFFASAFAVPLRNTREVRWSSFSSVRFGLLLLTAMMTSLVLAPALSRWFGERSNVRNLVSDIGGHHQTVLGGSKVTGFLVVPDGAEKSTLTPTMSISEFRRLVIATQLEVSLGEFLEYGTQHLPFAFVVGPRVDSPVFNIGVRLDSPYLGSPIYIAPPKVLLDKDVWAWRFRLQQRASTARYSYVLQEVIEAEPINRF